ncbi:SRPBCC family protein [Catellatospora sp. KI3]|uniref:SRPBCC family protein n=1 Tax=Catellatospora sp. KI3 TaxID=3041620 RepID=UPI0024829E82|nr:SRPBCC family protein [Catellatospora sp. KI3]MDI1463754.1 SRPBCC family protein [Catellatospora sp. KI3]
MTTYTAEKHIDHDLTDAFAYLADPANLPEYFPRITSARQVGPELVQTTAAVDTDGDGTPERVSGQAWFHADEAAHEITWGSPEHSDYHGSLKVTGGGDDTLLSLQIDADDDHPGIQQALDEALESIARHLAAHSPGRPDGRQRMGLPPVTGIIAPEM